MRLAALLLALGVCVAGPYRAADPANWETEFRQGMELLRNKKYAEARQHFQTATRLNPRYSEAYFYLGMTALHTGDRAAAEAALRRAVSLEPKAVNAL